MVTKWNLVQALLNGGGVVDSTQQINFRAVQAVEREDGSGRCYNVTGYDADGRLVTRFLRTVD